MNTILEKVHDLIDRLYEEIIGRIKKNIYNKVELTSVDIPLSYETVPLWNVKYALAQIIKKLEEDGYNVLYQKPNTIHITYQGIYKGYEKMIDESEKFLDARGAKYIRTIRSQGKKKSN